jgi:AraC-like DNA-binding protein
MGILHSTDTVPPSDRLGFWRDTVGSTFVPLEVSRAETDKPFSGAVETEQLGQTQISTVDADLQLVRRNRSLIARSTQDYFTIGLQGLGTGVVAQDGRTAPLNPGEFAAYDTTRPYTLDFPAPFRMLVFQMPRWALGLSDSDLRRVTGLTIGADHELAAIVAPFLFTVAAQAGSCPPEVGQTLARNVGDLLTTVFVEMLGRDSAATDAGQQALLFRIRSFIDAHLADPDLSAELIAAAHNISTRHLQRLFQQQSVTMSGWIRQRRLEECRRELGRPRRIRPTVGAVAHRWGFISPAHFSRAFHAAYGMSPREWQALFDRDGDPVQIPNHLETG